MIRTRGLTKRYGRITAVDGVDLDVREGDVYGFLGANGSGKTTTVRMLLGLVLATSGRIELLGERMPARGPAGAAAGRRAGRGAGGVPAPVRPAQPRAARRAGRRTATGAPAAARIGEALEQVGLAARGRAAGPGLLARHAAAARAGRRAAAPAAAADPRRADQRPGPAGHPGDPRPAARPQRGRHHGVPVQPPARRGRAAVHPGRRAGPRPAGAAGRAGRAAAADRPRRGAHPRRRAGPRAAGRRRGGVRRASGCWSATPDPAALNARLVRAGVRVTMLGAERRTLEEVVLAATSGERRPDRGAAASWADQ